MNVKEIKDLVDIVARRGLAALEIEQAGFRLRIEGPRPETISARRGEPRTEAVAELVTPGLGTAVPAALPGPAPAPTHAIPEDWHVVTSPIVGTFYRAPNPEAAPFVDVGATVEKGMTLCIVEAMKLMNEIESDVAGTVVEVFPKNGQPVEYGERLFAIRPR